MCHSSKLTEPEKGVIEASDFVASWLEIQEQPGLAIGI